MGGDSVDREAQPDDALTDEEQQVVVDQFEEVYRRSQETYDASVRIIRSLNPRKRRGFVVSGCACKGCGKRVVTLRAGSFEKWRTTGPAVATGATRGESPPGSPRTLSEFRAADRASPATQ